MDAGYISCRAQSKWKCKHLYAKVQKSFPFPLTVSVLTHHGGFYVLLCLSDMGFLQGKCRPSQRCPEAVPSDKACTHMLAANQLLASAPYCSFAHLCLTPCDPVDCSILGFLVLHHLSRVCSNSCPLSQWCHPTISSSVAPLSSFP